MADVWIYHCSFPVYVFHVDLQTLSDDFMNACDIVLREGRGLMVNERVQNIQSAGKHWGWLSSLLCQNLLDVRKLDIP